MRLIGPIVCGVQVALGLVLALTDCDSCRKGPPLAWCGIAYYAALGILARVPAAIPLARWMMRWACAVHAALVMVMIHHRDLCGWCLASAGVSLPLLVLSTEGDARPPWKWGIEFLSLVLVALAAANLAVGPAPRVPDSSSEPEIVVFRSERCPRCLEFERDVLPRIPREWRVTILQADDYSYVRVTPTIVVRGPSGSRVFEGAPSLETLLDSLPDWHQNTESAKGP